MDTNDYERLVYLSILAFAIGLPVLLSYGRLRDLLKPLLAWAVIFAIAIFGVGMWQSLNNSGPRNAQVTSSGDVVLPVGPDGHFTAILSVNGKPIEFMVDTGATEIVLSKVDAKKLGFDLSKLAFIGTAYTANGPVSSAPIRLESISLGPFHDENVRATVNGGDLFGSLLGMEYLRRFGSIEITRDAMILRR
jgi:aspartyl protease family protein